MAPASGLTHITPCNPPSPLEMPSHAAGNRHQLAEELMSAHRGVSYKGRLPTAAELPHTAFFVDPQNSGRGVIAYLDPTNPERATSYCFLSGSQEAMAEIKAKHKAYVAQTPGASPIERLPLEIPQKIVGHLWDEKGLWDDNKHVNSLVRTSKTMQSRLLEVSKVDEIHRRLEQLASLPAGQFIGVVRDIVAYAMSDQPVKLVSASLLAMFKDYVQVMTSDALDKSCLVDGATQLIRGMNEQYGQVKALSLLSERITPQFWLMLDNKKFQQGEALINIVENMGGAEAKAEGIAAVGYLLRMHGIVDRKSILYADRLLQLAENLEGASPAAMEKICQTFVDTRAHLARYCARHYDTAHFLHNITHNPEIDTEEVRDADLETGRKLDAFLARHDFVLPQTGGNSFLNPEFTPLWDQG